jgi:hypothetical protein
MEMLQDRVVPLSEPAVEILDRCATTPKEKKC